MRTIFIGDVHGCFEELQILLEKCQFKRSEDRLIFVGDLINKGPHSDKVLSFVMDGGYECILGNHELGFLKALENESLRRKRFHSLCDSLGPKLEKVAAWMYDLPLFIEERNFICIHGGIEPGVKLENQDPMIATRIRTWGGDPKDMDNENDPPWFELYQGSKKVIFGHWALLGLYKEGNIVGLDSGCCYGRRLSAYILEEDRIVQVDALKEYEKL